MEFFFSDTENAMNEALKQILPSYQKSDFLMTSTFIPMEFNFVDLVMLVNLVILVVLMALGMDTVPVSQVEGL